MQGGFNPCKVRLKWTLEMNMGGTPNQARWGPDWGEARWQVGRQGAAKGWGQMQEEGMGPDGSRGQMGEGVGPDRSRGQIGGQGVGQMEAGTRWGRGPLSCTLFPIWYPIPFLVPTPCLVPHPPICYPILPIRYPILPIWYPIPYLVPHPLIWYPIP